MHLRAKNPHYRGNGTINNTLLMRVLLKFIEIVWQALDVMEQICNKLYLKMIYKK
jgi:hypothetical protein